MHAESHAPTRGISQGEVGLFRAAEAAGDVPGGVHGPRRHGASPVPRAPGGRFASLLMIAVGAGASGCLNMWWDADIDAIMTRTAKRPIPAGRIAPDEALAFGLTLSVGSVLVLGLVSNWLAAGLLAFTIFFYVVIYSMWLKRATPQNIVIGGAAGALPPVVAQAAVTGSRRHREPHPVRHHLHLDAAAFLGAGARQIGRLRKRRHPDDAECRRPGFHPPTDPGVHDAARAARPGAGARSGSAALAYLVVSTIGGLGMLDAGRSGVPPARGRAGDAGAAATLRLLDPVPVSSVRDASRRARVRPPAAGLRDVMMAGRDLPQLTPEEHKRRRKRSMAIALALGVHGGPVLRGDDREARAAGRPLRNWTNAASARDPWSIAELGREALFEDVMSNQPDDQLS